MNFAPFILSLMLLGISFLMIYISTMHIQVEGQDISYYIFYLVLALFFMLIAVWVLYGGYKRSCRIL